MLDYIENIKVTLVLPISRHTKNIEFLVLTVAIFGILSTDNFYGINVVSRYDKNIVIYRVKDSPCTHILCILLVDQFIYCV